MTRVLLLLGLATMIANPRPLTEQGTFAMTAVVAPTQTVEDTAQATTTMQQDQVANNARCAIGNPGGANTGPPTLARNTADGATDNNLANAFPNSGYAEARTGSTIASPGVVGRHGRSTGTTLVATLKLPPLAQKVGQHDQRSPVVGSSARALRC